MKVTAKVVVATKQIQGEGTTYESYILNLNADYADGANKEWAAATPYLNLQMSVKGDVHEQFQLGDKLTLTFSKED